MNDGAVVVGGGLAAQRFCETLRKGGYDGELCVVSEEHHLPYDRPPLSKQFLLGEANHDDIALRPRAWYREQQVELLLGERATGLDPAGRRLHLDRKRSLRYETLLIATGSAPRRLPQAEGFANVHYLRTAKDARALRDALVPGSRLAVVGAGFIGQEVAASARRLGADVTIIEALAAPLERIVGARLGRWFAGMHRNEGVDVLLGTTITAFEGNETVERLVLDNGDVVECDAVLVGIGVSPATRWLESSGLPAEGVPVDELGRTAAEHVYAAGDAARPFDPQVGTHVRTEHWEAAARQAVAAASAVLGLPARPAGLPSFWSDQYGVRIQYLGNSSGADRIEFEGDPATRDFAAVFRRGSIPSAALLVGRPRELPAMRRRLVEARSARDTSKGGEADANHASEVLAAG